MQRMPQRRKGSGGGCNHYRLFELDMREMFPCLPRAVVLDAVRNIASAVMGALEGNGWVGGGGDPHAVQRYAVRHS